MCTIEFRVTAKVRLGETIHLLGDAALGYFEPTESIQLSTTPDSYPVWRTTQALNFAPGHTLKYRCGSLPHVATVLAPVAREGAQISYGGWGWMAARCRQGEAVACGVGSVANVVGLGLGGGWLAQGKWSGGERGGGRR